jgi:hypothetical protein
MNNKRELEIGLRSYLLPGEEILWADQPLQGLRLRPADIFVIPFSLLWGGFSFFWEYLVVSSGAPLIFALFGLPFVLVGIYLIVGRFFTDAATRARTVYAISDERVMIKTGLFGTIFYSYSTETLTDISLLEQNNGSGSVTFTPGTEEQENNPQGYKKPKMNPTFDMLANPREAYNKLLELQKQQLSRQL